MQLVEMKQIRKSFCAKQNQELTMNNDFQRPASPLTLSSHTHKHTHGQQQQQPSALPQHKLEMERKLEVEMFSCDGHG